MGQNGGNDPYSSLKEVTVYLRFLLRPILVPLILTKA